MHAAAHYRREAEHMHRLLPQVHQPELIDLLTRLAKSYEDIATEIETGAIKIVHPDKLPQCDPAEVEPGDRAICDPDS
jgi:hypothetical protein